MTQPDSRISRDDLEEKFRSLQSDLQGKLGAKKDSLIAIGSAIGVVVVILSYLFGNGAENVKVVASKFVASKASCFIFLDG